MNAIVTLAVKDLRLLTRDWFGLFWIFAFPLLYALFFGAIFSSAGGGNRAIQLAVVDLANTESSKAFVASLEKSEVLTLEKVPLEDAVQLVRKGKKTAVLVIKSGFDGPASLFGGTPRALELGIDPSRRADAEVLRGLVMEVLFADMKDLFTDPARARGEVKQAFASVEKAKNLNELDKATFRLFFGALDSFLDRMPAAEAGKEPGGFMPVDLQIKDLSSSEGRPRSAFEITFPSSILWGIMGSVTSFAVSLVQERNRGTFLRLRAAPLSFGQILAGKGLGCFLTCVFVTCVLLTFASLCLGVRLDNLAFLAMGIASLAFCFTGLMMFISTLGRTEQGVAGAGWGMMMPMAMLGGGMVPLIAMPAWMLVASHVSPVKWGILALEGAIWRQFSLGEMLLPCGILLAVGALGYSAGVWTLQRREA